ncbi:hypothetical protein EPK99_14665 [Neorhizobium lilium]|uniref:Uncharacterized protein n=1 Tax=Neorhizobium lilium TaxID=2503024 RepID=A0A444LFE3_9HYPH|nr:hypothetical protein [Neorhizobium lilium]RWX76907.1 hypothetical protein EPK99_14665 [Neorhizobium lilium]
MSFFEKAKIAALAANTKFSEFLEKQKQAQAEREIKSRAERARAEAEQAERDRIEAEERRKFEQKRESTKYFQFWNRRGTAYKVSKERYREGDHSYIMTKLHLDVPGSDEIKVVVPKCDFPVTNGNDVVVIYGSTLEIDSGPLLRIINITKNTAFDVDDNIETISKRSSLERSYALKRVHRDFRKYISSL